MAQSPRKIVLYAKFEGEDEEKDTFLRVNSNTLEISDFEKEPIPCDLFVSRSLKLHESPSRERPKSPTPTDSDEPLMQEIINLHKRLDKIQTEIKEKNSNVHIQGNTIWITYQDSLGNLKVNDVQNVKQRTSITQEKEYGFQFSQTHEEPLQSGGYGYADKSDYSKTPSTERMSVNREDLSEMQKTSSTVYIKKEYPDPEPEDNAQKMSLSRETLTKIKSEKIEPIEEVYRPSFQSSFCGSGTQDDIRSNLSFCTN